MIGHQERVIHLEFQRFLNFHRDEPFYVKYLHKGKMHTLKFPEDKGRLQWDQYPFFARKFIIFRNLPAPGQPCHCVW